MVIICFYGLLNIQTTRPRQSVERHFYLNIQHPPHWVRVDEHQEASISTAIGEAVDDFDCHGLMVASAVRIRPTQGGVHSLEIEGHGFACAEFRRQGARASAERLINASGNKCIALGA
jgi:hypothetical protein